MAHPKDKSNVEAMVKLVYRRVYSELRNRSFFSIGELNEAVQEKVRLLNQTHMQQHPFSREERFLAVDRPNLQPLPDTDFEIRYYADLQVMNNNCIYLGRDQHYYSVPYQYVGQRALVVYTRTMVTVYVNGQQLMDFMELIEDRHGRSSTIIVSQLPVSAWYAVLKGNTTAADAILDRLVHTAYRFELRGTVSERDRMTDILLEPAKKTKKCSG